MKLVDLKKILRMDDLIQRECTGTPEEFAGRLHFSRTTFFAYLAYFREELGAGIRYDAYRQTYYYEEEHTCIWLCASHCAFCKKKQ